MSADASAITPGPARGARGKSKVAKYGLRGIALGYLCYGLVHDAIHARRFQQPLLRRWAGLHHVHHHHPDTNFGVTTPLWDVVFGTRYRRKPRD